jgi:DnaK suppressor protein
MQRLRKTVRKKEDKCEVARKKLMEMRQNLIRVTKDEIGQLVNKEDRYNGVSDEGDLTEVAIRNSMQASNVTRHQSQLKVIEEALRKIDEGIYGICEDCGESIPIGRLNVMPFALRCIACQENSEMTHAEKEEQIIKLPVPPEEESED